MNYMSTYSQALTFFNHIYCEMNKVCSHKTNNAGSHNETNNAGSHNETNKAGSHNETNKVSYHLVLSHTFYSLKNIFMSETLRNTSTLLI